MIGILGGMGTQAGLDFCSKLAKLNRGKADQKYPLFVLYNKANIFLGVSFCISEIVVTRIRKGKTKWQISVQPRRFIRWKHL